MLRKIALLSIFPLLLTGCAFHWDVPAEVRTKDGQVHMCNSLGTGNHADGKIRCYHGNNKIHTDIPWSEVARITTK